MRKGFSYIELPIKNRYAHGIERIQIVRKLSYFGSYCAAMRFKPRLDIVIVYQPQYGMYFKQCSRARKFCVAKSRLQI